MSQRDGSTPGIEAGETPDSGPPTHKLTPRTARLVQHAKRAVEAAHEAVAQDVGPVKVGRQTAEAIDRLTYLRQAAGVLVNVVTQLDFLLVNNVVDLEHKPSRPSHE